MTVKTSHTHREIKQVAARIPREGVPGLSADGSMMFINTLIERLAHICRHIDTKEEPHSALLKLERALLEDIVHQFIDLLLKRKNSWPQANDQYEYSVGRLTQWCNTCGWKSEKLVKEVKSCPVCGASVSENCTLSLANTKITFTGPNRFCFFPDPPDHSGPEKSVVYEDDLMDTVVFMLRHGKLREKEPLANQMSDTHLEHLLGASGVTPMRHLG